MLGVLHEHHSFYFQLKCLSARVYTTHRHYRPVDFDDTSIRDEIHYSVPEHWNVRAPPKEGLDEFQMVGTSFKEPNCKNLLCALGE